MFNRFLLALIIVAFVLTIPVYCFELADFGIGSRGLGMGRSGTAFIQDASCVFMNPGSISLIKKHNFLSALSNPMTDTSYVALATTVPESLEGSMGFGYEYLGIANISLVTTTTPESVNYGAHEFIISYSKPLTLFEDLKEAYVGGSFKFFSQGYSKDIPAASGSVGTGMDADLGATYLPRKYLSFGLLMQNILPASFLGKMVWQNGKEEGIPATIKAGTALKVWGLDSISNYEEQKLDLAFDIESAPTRKLPALFHMGLEWGPSQFTSIRAGYDQTPRGETDVYSNMAFGFGVQAQGFTFDYSYMKFNDGSGQITHTFSLGYIGAPEPKPVKEVVVYAQTTPEVAGIKTMKRRHFIDVPKTHWAVDPIELLATAQLLSGYPGDIFKPSKNMTRADFCLMILNAKNLEVTDVNAKVFKDVSAKSPVARQVKAVKDVGAVVGYPDWRFKPYKAITRAEALKVFAVFDNIQPESYVSSTPYVDVKSNHFVAPYLSALIEKGFISSRGNLNPNKVVSRAEIASMLYKTSFGQAAVRRLPPLVD